MQDVNLLPEQKLEEEQKSQTNKSFVKAVVGLTLVSAIAWGGLFSFQFTLQAAENSLDARKTDALRQFTELSPVASDLVNLKNKTQGISDVEKKSVNFFDSFSYVNSLFVFGMKMTRVSLTDDGGVVVVQIAPDTNSLSAFLAEIQKEARLKDSRVSGLQLNETGGYSFSIKANYGGSTKEK